MLHLFHPLRAALLLFLTYKLTCVGATPSLSITGFCPDKAHLNGLWTPASPTASGRYYYTHEEAESYFYYDPDCGLGTILNRWIIDKQQPDTTAEADLDGGDGKCKADGYGLSTTTTTPTTGRYYVNCDYMWTGVTLIVTPQAEISCGAGLEPFAPVTDGGVWTCIPCSAGYYSSTFSLAVCTPCPANHYSANAGGTDESVCSPCPPTLPSSDPGSGECEPPPDQCVAIKVEGCGGATWETTVSGTYKVYNGTCEGATADRPAYVHELSGNYLFHSHNGDSGPNWRQGLVCGGAPFLALGGGDSLYPFVGTPPIWQCAHMNEWVEKPMSISCSVYAGQLTTCKPGTYNETGGLGPEGLCHDCPDHLPSSFPGSTSSTQCFTTKANVLTVSLDVNRITIFNSHTNDHRLLAEGGAVIAPYDAAFISATDFVVSMYYGMVVLIMNFEGETVGTFANVDNPTGLIFLPKKRKVAVASASNNAIFFFDLDDYKDDPLEMSDAVATISNEELGVGDFRYFSIGETDDEMLATTKDNKVIRICVPASTSCKPSLRNRVMVSGGTNVRGVGVLREKESYLVVDSISHLGYIRQCPLSSVGITIDSCSVFAYEPEGAVWLPWGLLVDELKKLVYVTDKDKGIIHVFSYDGVYFGHLADKAMFLSQPRGLATKPGALAAISPITPPPSATAGEPIMTNMDLRARDNKPFSSTYNITSELSRFQVTATGLVNGFDTTIHGSVPSASEAHILIKFAGMWEISVMEGIKNPQHLHGSPYLITVDPASTNPVHCVLSFSGTVVAGDEFTATVAPFDEFGNPTTHSEDKFNFYFDSEESGRTALIRTPPETFFAMSRVKSAAGTHSIHVFHRNTAGTEVSGSPFYFQVLAAAASAESSEHNIKAGTELVSKKELVVDLRVFPKDVFNNTITEAAGYAVRIDRVGEISLTAPDFEYELVIEAGFEGSVEFVFTLNGEEIRGGRASIKVKKPGKTVMTKTNIYIGVFGFVSAVVIVLVLKMLLDENATSADVMTKGAEMASIAKSMGTNILDPVTDFTSWFLVIRKCGGWVSNVYLFFVMVAFVTTGQSVRTSVKQLSFLSKDNGGGKLASQQSRVELIQQVSMGSAEMDEVFVELRKKYPEQNAIAKKAKGVLSMLKKGNGAVAPVLDPDPADETAEQKEKRLLGIFRNIVKMNRDIGQRERKEERVSGAVLQVFVEDIPGTIFNALYVIYGCVNLEEEDKEGGAAAKMFVFMLATFLSVALGVKKFLEWRQIKADRRNVESWIEIVEHRLVDATKLLREIKGEGDEGDLEEGKDAFIAKLERESQALKEEVRRTEGTSN